MICTELKDGQGLGNQLHSYIACRVIAKDLGVPFFILGGSTFKGQDFLNLDFGEPSTWEDKLKFWTETDVRDMDNVDIRPYDETVKDIQPGTMIDGIFQDEKYFEHRMSDIEQWLQVEPLRMWDNVCVINFRGGEYKWVKDLFLTKEYWDAAIEEMRKINKDMKFEVHTDDPEEAAKFFPEFVIKTGMAINWRSIRYAHYLILSNSSFAIFPALLNTTAKHIIAPKYWARRNIGVWSTNQNKYKKFTYI